MKFNKNNWNCTKQELVKELEQFYSEFGLASYSGWTTKDINLVLQIKFHLVKGNSRPKHTKQIKKILEILQ